MKQIILLFLFGTVWCDTVIAQPCISPEGEAFYNRAMKEINTKHVSWVKSTAASAKQNNSSQQTINQFASTYGASMNMGTMDIEALVSFVMMQIVKDTNEDLRQMLEGMKKQNEQKKALRDYINKIKRQQAAGKEMLRAEYDSIRKMLPESNSANKTRIVDSEKRVSPGLMVVQQKVTPAQVNELKMEIMEKLDSLSDMSEMMSLRLQMYMDRYSKFMSTLSNMLKKMSDTSDTIIGNLK